MVTVMVTLIPLSGNIQREHIVLKMVFFYGYNQVFLNTMETKLQN